MKILMITDLYPPITVGGYEISCKETANELSRRDHNVIILTSKWGVESASVEGNVYRLLFFNALNDPRKHNINDLFCLRKRYRQFRWGVESRQNYKIARDFITATRPDLAIIWNMGNVGVGPVLAAQAQNVPRVFNIGDNWLLRLKSELYDEPNLVRRKFQGVINGLNDFRQLDINHLLVVSNVLKQTYIKNGFPEQNIHVIPLGIRSDLVFPIRALCDLPRNRNGTLRLLFVGRLVPEKAPDVAINALEVLKRKYGVQDVSLDIIGQGPKEYTLSLKNTVLELNLEENVNFLGWLEHSLIFDRYPDYDALLFPSRWEEPLGMTVLEAMARGLPVIASRRGGPLEIISDGENGLLVPPDEPVALAEAILRLFQNDGLTQKIRVEGIKTITGQYTLENFVDKSLEYIQAVLDTSGLNKDQKKIM